MKILLYKQLTQLKTRLVSVSVYFIKTCHMHLHVQCGQYIEICWSTECTL